jgi:hypothetical protein
LAGSILIVSSATHGAVVIHDRLAQEPHLVERIAHPSFRGPGAMDEQIVQGQHHVVQEVRLEGGDAESSCEPSLERLRAAASRAWYAEPARRPATGTWPRIRACSVDREHRSTSSAIRCAAVRKILFGAADDCVVAGKLEPAARVRLCGVWGGMGVGVWGVGGGGGGVGGGGGGGGGWGGGGGGWWGKGGGCGGGWYE